MIINKINSIVEFLEDNVLRYVILIAIAASLVLLFHVLGYI